MGKCYQCRNPIQSTGSMRCAVDDTYIYCVGEGGCENKFEKRDETIKWREQMRLTAKRFEWTWYSSRLDPYSNHFKCKMFFVRYIPKQKGKEKFERVRIFILSIKTFFNRYLYNPIRSMLSNFTRSTGAGGSQLR